MDIVLFSRFNNITKKCGNVLYYVYYSEPNSISVTQANTTVTVVSLILKSVFIIHLNGKFKFRPLLPKTTAQIIRHDLIESLLI